jgi:hypothetical protein
MSVNTFVAAVGLLESIREHRFAPSRRWRFDLAWPFSRLALETARPLRTQIDFANQRD